jgi:hypothetical protein
MINILPFEHLTAKFFQNLERTVSEDYLEPLKNKSFRFSPTARHAITAVLNSLKVEPTDKIYLTNTTGQTYISACVTCTIFNFCKPSRVLSNKTKAIFIIHENGVPHPELGCLIEEGKKRKIPVIEDCTHTYEELIRIREMFPDRILTWIAYLDSQAIAGALFFCVIPKQQTAFTSATMTSTLHTVERIW